jgi:hypothetical protein
MSWALLGSAPAGGEALSSAADSPTGMFMLIGIVLAVLAVATAVLVFQKMWIYLWATGGAAILAIGYGFLTLSSKLGEAKQAAGLAGDLGKLISDAIQPGWGWAVLLVGAALILGAAFLKQQETR